MEKESDEFWGGLLKQLSLYTLGRHTEADALLAEFIENYQHFGAYQIAETYAWKNEPDEAFRWLETAFDQHDPGMGSLLKDASLRVLHEDPRWEILLDRIGLLEAWKEMPAKLRDSGQ